MSDEEVVNSNTITFGRRQFVAQSAAGVGALLATNSDAAMPTANNTIPGIPVRPLGKTGVSVSLLGLGGHALGQCQSEADAMQLAHEAIDSGVTFFDNAWEYHKGRSEDWMGKALQGRRDKVFLMTKVCSHGRDAKTAMTQLEESLRRLRTDHLDLWQIHEVVYDSDPDLHFRIGGAVEALAAAKQAGKVRFVGFTGHKSPAIHKKMLSHKFPFDTVQMPLNAFDASYRSFENEVLPELIAQGIAPIAMKSLNGTADCIKRGLLTASEALRYVMSLPIATLVSGMNSLSVMRENVAIARSFKPMTPDEMAALRKRVAGAAADGRFELYKSSMKFDGDVGRGQHGFPLLENVAI